MNWSCKFRSTNNVFLWLGLLAAAMPAVAQSAGNSVPDNSSRFARTASESAQRLRPADAEVIEPSSPNVLSDSRIGPDDLLSVTVFEAPEMNATLRVSASGDISMQLVGEVHVEGLTTSQVQSVLQGMLRRTYMRDPHVGVFIQELQSHAVSVVGAVKMPGVFQIRGPKSLLEILSMAQGLADDAGDTVSIMRGAGQANSDHPGGTTADASEATVASDRRDLPVQNDAANLSLPEQTARTENVNLKQLLGSSDSSSNVLVHPGDVVKVSRAGIVYVVGEVNKPGGFVLQNNESISILQALALAQGTTHTSAVRGARIIRTDLVSGKRTEISVNLTKIFSGKRPDILLEPKDVVFVPNSAAKSVFYRGSETALQTAAGVAIYKW
jgi:polysaccharide export outer membrane protein